MPRRPKDESAQDPDATQESHPATPDDDPGDDAPAPPEGNESARAGRVNPDA